tara:strand:- start:307 stop:2145 length:1839 start_codon:yes stop_codon:yes gene_type:complete
VSYILGISAFYHDSAAALLENGIIVAAAQEERFSRKKHDSRYPFNAIDFVLKYKNLKLSDIDHIVFYEKPFLKFERLLETYVAFSPKGFQPFCMAMPLWLKEKLFQKKMLLNKLKQHDENFKDINKIYFSEHHYSHAASAFFLSPFKEAAVLTLDGVGEWSTTTISKGENEKLEILKEIHFPHSLGLLYSAFTYYIGFKVNSGEYKVMGLAPYGEPKYRDLILKELIDVKEDGSFKLNMKYFNYATGLTMTNAKFSNLFGNPVRKPEIDKITQFHMDLAASIQSVIEEIILKIVNSLSKYVDSNNLCLAGGVALNCVVNGKILKQTKYKNIWIQPAAGDAGGAVGAAIAFWYKELNNKRLIPTQDQMNGSYLGPSFNNNEIEEKLNNLKANFKKYSEEDLIEKIANDLSSGKTIGWFQGRMEFGPRALGARSILADPRNEKMQKELNLKVKYRESFRPFAPSILREDLEKWFDLNCDSPYMLFVSKVNKKLQLPMSEKDKKLFGIDKLNIKRSSIPAVTHIDYTARIQTVHSETNPRYHKLINAFKEKTGCPILVNTSFNIRGEPIVCTVEDAYKCFINTNLDILVCENFIMYKDEQTSNKNREIKKQINLD